jgi:peptidase M28-like protein
VPRLDVPRPEDVRQLLGALSADSMEGRGTGARGSARAARLIADRLAAAGLVPAGDSGFFQRVPMRFAVSQRSGRLSASAVRTWADFNALPSDQRTIGVNVVGILPGTDSTLRSQAILVDAHYDHLGIGRAENGDSIYNGADDDGSGTVAVMEIARILAAQGGNKRTIIFAATTGEEVGLVGTNWYIAYPPFPLAQTVANFEIEMIGRPDPLSGGAGTGWLTGYGLSTMGPMLAAAGIPVVADPRPDQQFFQRSDNIAFARLGIVAHTWSSFNLHDDYHQLTDDVSKVDFEHMARLIDAAARAVWVLANGETAKWNPGAQPAARPTRLVQPPTRPPR